MPRGDKKVMPRVLAIVISRPFLTDTTFTSDRITHLIPDFLRKREGGL